MIIDIINKNCFVHIPNTAGTTWANWIGRMAATQRWQENFEQFYREDGQVELYPGVAYSIDNDIIGQDYLTVRDWMMQNISLETISHQPAYQFDKTGYNLYSIIRNPYERQVSIFFHWRKRFSNINLSTISDTSDLKAAIVDFVNSNAGESFESFIRWKYTGNNGNPIECPFTLNLDMYHFTHDSDGNDLINTYIRYENLKEDWAVVARQYNYPVNVFDIVQNCSRYPEDVGKHYSSYYTDAALALVESHVERDCQTFGYKFETA